MVHCHLCNKKLNIINRFLCYCGNTFCSVHRYIESHSCPMTAKVIEAQKKDLEKNLIPIIPEKLESL